MDFAAGKPVSGPSGRTKTGKELEKYYGVAVGRIPGVYTEWSEAQRQIADVKGPKFKKFATKEEAEEFVKTGGKFTGKAAEVNGKTRVVKKEVKKAATKEVKTEQAESSQPAAKKAKTSVDSTSKDKTVKVYTDGSSLSNGKVGALAGVGVYFGDGDSR
jgi:ribonuclease HI